MAKPAKKRTPTAPVTQPNRPEIPRAQTKSTGNPRLQADNRWQRTKRYGWDSR